MDYERNKNIIMKLSNFNSRIKRYRETCGNDEQYQKLSEIRDEIELFISKIVIDDYDSILNTYKELKNTYGIN